MPFDRSTSPARLRSRTRAALGQLVGDVLSTQLGALENRLSRSGWLATRPSAGSATGGRLREVLDRDRALLAAQPECATLATLEQLTPPSQSPTPAEASPAPLQAATTPTAPMPKESAEDVEREPIRTRTMARLLAAQGYHARALAIYGALLAECPGDAELLAEIERVRAQPA